jgi:hypothetical protein
MQTVKFAGVPFLGLGPTSCRWPMGGLQEPANFFCGEPVVLGCSWCEKHRLRALTPAAASKYAATSGKDPHSLSPPRLTLVND